MNFSLFLEMRARGTPDALALVDRYHRLSYRELDEAANRFANLLEQRGCRRGDRLAIYLPNRAELAIAFLGALKASVIAVPLNWRLQGPDLARVVEHCAPSSIVTTEARVGMLRTREPSETLTVGDAPYAGSFWSALGSYEPRFRCRGCQSNDIANLLYTSGTTSTPKAVIHTHGMRVAIAAAMADFFQLSCRDIGLAISPMFHTSGMSVLSNAIFVGSSLVMLDHWDLTEFLKTIEREQVTFMHLISTIIVDITRAPESLFKQGPSSVRLTWSGGHSVDPEVFRTFEHRIGGILLQGYGRTEGGFTYNPLDPKLRRFDRHGFPNRNSSDITIIDPATERMCLTGQVGEIAVRGDGVSPGYWDGGFLRSCRPYDGGWQPTGDLGLLDEDGALHFLGRNDDMIKTGGENVYPAEVTAVLLAMPEVADAVVVGLPDDRLGHRVAALVVPTHPSLSAAAIDKACRQNLAGFKIPRTICLTQALPRLATQKIDIAACRDLLARATSAE